VRGAARPTVDVRRAGMNTDAFAQHRGLLFTVAYEMLGSASDAEDCVQETWLRWATVDQSIVRDVRAFLLCIITRQALNRLRTLSRRREDYVGEWQLAPGPALPATLRSGRRPRTARFAEEGGVLEPRLVGRRSASVLLPAARRHSGRIRQRPRANRTLRSKTHARLTRSKGDRSS
jgi:DNA-directed RNA polymerase specialized sigma24 family protein